MSMAQSSKVVLTFVGVGILLFIGIMFVVFQQWSAGLWALWFGAFDGVIIQYVAANVWQKKILK